MNSSGRISDERADGVQDALALDDRFGFDRDAMAAGELDAQRRQRLVVGRRAVLPRRRRPPTAAIARKPGVERARELGVVRRARRPRDHQPAAAILA